MKSRTQARRRRLFGWGAAISTLVAVGLLGMEILLPTAPEAPFASSSGGEFRRLLLLIAVAFALASIAGTIVTAVRAWVTQWRGRKEAASAPHERFGLTAEPANERLRALRAVTLEEISIRGEPGHPS